MTANESLVGGLHVDLRMAAWCGWPRPVVDQAIGLAVQERDLEVAGAGKMFSKFPVSPSATATTNGSPTCAGATS
jgi:hypothetical protein